jgi:hypothetical protein
MLDPLSVPNFENEGSRDDRSATFQRWLSQGGISLRPRITTIHFPCPASIARGARSMTALNDIITGNVDDFLDR